MFYDKTFSVIPRLDRGIQAFQGLLSYPLTTCGYDRKIIFNFEIGSINNLSMND